MGPPQLGLAGLKKLPDEKTRRVDVVQTEHQILVPIVIGPKLLQKRPKKILRPKKKRIINRLG